MSFPEESKIIYFRYRTQFSTQAPHPLTTPDNGKSDTQFMHSIIRLFRFWICTEMLVYRDSIQMFACSVLSQRSIMRGLSLVRSTWLLPVGFCIGGGGCQVDSSRVPVRCNRETGGFSMQIRTSPYNTTSKSKRKPACV